MTGTDADFHRLLPLAFPGITFNAKTRRFTAADGSWCLDLGPPATRSIANLTLPTCDVCLTLPEAEAEAITARFLRYFQRGGG